MTIDQLKIILANHIEAQLTVQGFHWNVEGADFTQYHDFFGEIYHHYYTQVDRIAEYVRSVSQAKEYVIATVDVVVANKTIKSQVITGNNTTKMVTEIIRINNILLENFKQVRVFAFNGYHNDLANYCDEQQDYLSKLNWKLTSITK